MPVSIRVAGSGVAPHSLPLEMHQGRNAVLKLGRPGRVVGIVRTASGVPLADVPVELWVQGGRTSAERPFGERFANRRITPDEILRLDPEPLKTGPQGTFQTPSTLLCGSTLPRGHPTRRVSAVCLRLGDVEWRSGRDPGHPSPAGPDVDGADQGPAGTRGRRRPGLRAGWRCRKRRLMPKGDLRSPATSREKPSYWSSRRIPASGLVGRSSATGRRGDTDPSAHERNPGAGHEATGRSNSAGGIASPGESPARTVLA